MTPKSWNGVLNTLPLAHSQPSNLSRERAFDAESTNSCNIGSKQFGIFYVRSDQHSLRHQAELVSSSANLEKWSILYAISTHD